MLVLGDTHSITAVKKILTFNKIENQKVIHVGDFGLGFQEIRRDVQALLDLEEFLLEKGITLYVIRGNHDYKCFWDGSIKLPNLHALILVPDNMVIDVDGKKCLFVGGGISIDRSTRIFDRTWDINEKFILDKNLIESLRDIDIVVTHSAPDFCEPVHFGHLVNTYHTQEKQVLGTDLKSELTEERALLTEMYNILAKNNDIEKWYFGHFHRSTFLTIQHTSFIGLDIDELKQI